MHWEASCALLPVALGFAAPVLSLLTGWTDPRGRERAQAGVAAVLLVLQLASRVGDVTLELFGPSIPRPGLCGARS